MLTDLIQRIKYWGNQISGFNAVAKALEYLRDNPVGGGKFGVAGQDNIGAEPRIFERRGEDFFVIDDDNDWFSYFGAYGNDGSCEMYAQDPNVSNKWGDVYVTPDELSIGVGAGSNIRLYGAGLDANPHSFYCLDNSGNYLRRITPEQLATLLGIGGGPGATPYTVESVTGQGAHVGNMNTAMHSIEVDAGQLKRFRFTLYLRRSNDAAASNFFIGMRDVINGPQDFSQYIITFKFSTATGVKVAYSQNIPSAGAGTECPAAWNTGQLMVVIEGALKAGAGTCMPTLMLDSNTGSAEYTEIIEGSAVEIY